MTRNQYILTLLLTALSLNEGYTQSTNQIPRLVVTINIDQLRSDYLQAFTPLYGEGGFKKLLSEGRVYERTVNDFFPADRASATATISTGTMPYYNGIVGNSWLDRQSLRPVYCTDDKKFTASASRDAASARMLLTTTVGDELKVFTQGTAKVIGIAPDKEAAILSVGHAADFAIWIDSKTGHWVTSDYFKGINATLLSSFERMHSLPSNIKSTKWTPVSLLSGNVSFFMGSGKQEPFSHTFTGNSCYTDYKRSALVNADITDLALQCVTTTLMGKDDITDLLAVTYFAGSYKDAALSQTHREIQDTYARLDQEIERMIKDIEGKVGKDNVMFVLTSTGYGDTGTDDYTELGIPSGTFYINRTANLLNMYLAAIFGQAQYVDAVYHNQIYFNHKLLEEKHLPLTDMLVRSREFLILSEGVRDVHTAERILSPGNADVYKIRNAYNPTLCGDIIVEVAPGWKVVNEDTGETFTASASYSIFPTVFYGGGVKNETISTLVTTDCIAPTICKCIRIRAPNACKTLPLF